MPPTSPKPKPPPRSSSLSDEATRQRRAAGQPARDAAYAARQRRDTERAAQRAAAYAPAPSGPAPAERPAKPKLEGSAYGVPTTVDIAKRVGQGTARARIPTGNRQYQGVILAEFVVAALIVALAPLARGKAAQDKTTGPSPYGVDDIKQLAGIGAVYFVLALLSSGKYGRYSAWFGGLVLVAIGLAQTTSGGLPAIFAIFQPSSKSAGPPSDSTLASVPLGYLPTNGPLPTPTGAPTFGESVTSGGAVSSVQFTQPGVIVSDQGNVQINP